MSKNVQFHGATLVRAGGYTYVDPSGAAGIAKVPTGNVVLIGEADGGEPDNPYVFYNDLSAETVFRKGPLVDALHNIFNPASDSRLPGGTSKAIVIKTNQSLQGDILVATDAGTTVVGSVTFTNGSTAITVSAPSPAPYPFDAAEGSAILAPDGLWYYITDVAAPVTGTQTATLHTKYRGTTGAAAGPHTLGVTHFFIRHKDWGAHTNYPQFAMEYNATTKKYSWDYKNEAGEVSSGESEVDEDDGFTLTYAKPSSGSHNTHGYAAYRWERSGTSYILKLYSKATAIVFGDTATHTFTFTATQLQTLTLSDLISQINTCEPGVWEATISASKILTNGDKVAQLVGEGQRWDYAGILGGGNNSVFPIFSIRKSTNDPIQICSTGNGSLNMEMLGYYTAWKMSTLLSEVDIFWCNADTTIALDNGYAPLTGGVRGWSSSTGITDDLRLLDDAGRFSHIVPCWSKDIPTASTDIDWRALMVSLLDDTKWRNSIKGKNECVIYFGAYVDDLDDLRVLKRTLNSQYAQLYIQEVKRQSSLASQANQIVWCEPWAHAALAAGAIAGAPVGTALTHKYLNYDSCRLVDENGVNITSTFGADIETVAAVFINLGVQLAMPARDLEGELLGWRMERDLTTYTREDNDTLTERSQVACWQHCAFKLRYGLEVKFTGSRALPIQAAMVRTEIVQICDSLVEDGATTNGVKNGQAVGPYIIHKCESSGDTVEYSVEVFPTPTTNYLLNDLVLGRAGNV